jgi:hypothetical protein
MPRKRDLREGSASLTYQSLQELKGVPVRDSAVLVSLQREEPGQVGMIVRHRIPLFRYSLLKKVPNFYTRQKRPYSDTDITSSTSL